ncbi:MAG: hypothetical protein KAS87_06510 [Candidatus Omnitrophica bacterium]|nr:hypothetical protein [Candidatus Omnitrophota bacterium]
MIIEILFIAWMTFLGICIWKIIKIQNILSSEPNTEEEKKKHEKYLRELAEGVCEGKYYLEVDTVSAPFLGQMTYLKTNKAVKGDSWSPVITLEEYEQIKEKVSELKGETKPKEEEKRLDNIISEINKVRT